jgi:hypothetical protein
VTLTGARFGSTRVRTGSCGSAKPRGGSDALANRAVKWAWKQDLKPAPKAVLVALADMADKDLRCYPGQRLLAEMTGYSEKTVERALNDLDTANLIGRSRRAGRGGYRTSDLYELRVPPTGHHDGKANQAESREGEADLPDILTDQTDSVSSPTRHSDGAEENPQVEPLEEHRVADRPVTLGTKFAAPLCEVLVEAMRSNGAKTPSTVTKAWLDDARLMIDRDHRDPHEAKSLIEWATSDSFWRANILSMPKFRERYDQLRMQRDRAVGEAEASDPSAGMRVFGGPDRIGLD